jgi:hypothetical protein
VKRVSGVTRSNRGQVLFYGVRRNKQIDENHRKGNIKYVNVLKAVIM